MSSVDTRVVEMRFDNKQFESGVKETMKTLEKFKNSLNMSGVEKGFEVITDACEKVTEKFSVFGVITDQILRNIANKITSMGHQFLRSINQMGAGMQKYESLMNATRTMMNATGKSVKEIEGSMYLLNKYTDETSYNFSDLVSSMSSMMSSGAIKDLETAERTMEGIANASAHAGIGIHQASGVINVLTKAMSEGKMSRIRWESLQLQNFITPQFIEQAIEAGKALGKLDKSGKILSGKGKSKVVNNQTIMDTLQYGWMDAEVMSRVFEVYADTTGKFGELGSKAFEAAKEARTFTDVIDSLKDAISTGWMKSFEYLFGNVEQAAKLFTWMANELIDVSSAISEFRNELLADWNENGGRNSLVNTIVYIWETLKTIGGQITTAFTNVMGVLESEQLLEFTNKVQAAVQRMYMWLGENANEGGDKIAPRMVLIRQAFEGLFSVLSFGVDVVKGFFGLFGDVISTLFGSSDSFLMSVGAWGREIRKFFDTIRQNGDVPRFFSDLFETVKPFVESIRDFATAVFNFIGSLAGLKIVGEETETFGEKVSNAFSWIGDGFKSVLSFLTKAVKRITHWFDFLSKATDSKDLAERFSAIFDSIKKWFVGFSSNFVSWLKEIWPPIKKWFAETVANIGSWIRETWPKIKEWVLETFAKIGNWIQETWPKVRDAVSNWFTSFIDSLPETWQKVKAKLEKFFGKIGQWFSDTFGRIFAGKENSKSPIAPVKEFAEEVVTTLDAIPQDGNPEGSVRFFNLIGEIFKVIEETIYAIIGTIRGILTAIAWIGENAWLVGIITFVAAAIALSVQISRSLHWFAVITKGYPKEKQTISARFKEIALAIGIIAASISVLAMVSSKYSIWSAFGVIMLTLAAVIGIGAAIGGLSNKFPRLKLNNLGDYIRDLGLGLLAISVSLGVIGWVMGYLNDKFPGDKFWKGAGKVGVIILGLGLIYAGLSWITKEISHNSTNEWKSILALSASLVIIVQVMKGLATFFEKGVDVWSVIGAVLAIGALMAAVGAAIRIAGDSKVKTGPFLGIAAVVVALGLLFETVNNAARKIANLSDFFEFIAVIGSMLGVLVLLGVVVRMASNANNPKAVNSVSLVFMALSGVIVALTVLFNTARNLSFGQIVGLLGGLALVLASLSAVIKASENVKISKLVIISATMVLLAGVIFATVFAISLIPKDIDWRMVASFLGGIAAMLLATSLIVLFASGQSFSKLAGVALIMVGLAGLVIATGFAISLIPRDISWTMVAIFFAGLTAMLIAVAVVTVSATLVRFTALAGVALIMLGVAALAIAAGFAISLIPKDISWELVVAFFAGLTAMLLAVAVVTVSATLARFTALAGVALVMVGVAILAIASAYALSLIPRDLDWKSILAFFGGLTVMLLGISVAALVAGFIPPGGVLNIAIVVAAIGAVVAALTFLGALAGGAFVSMMSDFSSGSFILGSALSTFQELINGVDPNAIKAKLGVIADIIGSFGSMVGVDYSAVDSFRTGIFALGVALKGFNTRLSLIDRTVIKEKLKVVDDIKSVAELIREIPRIGDMSGIIANIGGAIRVYYDSLNGIDMTPKDKDGNPIDTSQIDSQGFIQMFRAIAGQMPDSSDLEAVGRYADNSTGTALGNFAAGIVNLSTALTTFSADMAKVKPDEVQNGITLLQQFSGIAQSLPETQDFDDFTGFFRGKKETLSDFGSDIEAVGEALASFGTSIGGALTVVDETTGKTNMQSGIEALQSLQEIGNALPSRTSPIAFWTERKMSLGEFGANMSTLGDGLNQFVTNAFKNNATYDKDQVGSIASIVETFVEIQNKIEHKNWGDAISNFAGFLAQAGTGVKDFNQNIMYGTDGQEVNYNIQKLEDLSKIVSLFVDIQNKIKNKDPGNAINNFAGFLVEASGNFKTFFEAASTWTIDNDKLWAIGEMAMGLASAFGREFGDDSASEIEDYSSETIMTAISGIVTKILASFKTDGDFYANMVSCGKYMDLGLEEGINSYAYKPVEAIGRVGSSMVERVRRVNMIRSPSRVMEEIGMYMILGLDEGITGYGDVPVNSIADLCNLIIETQRDIFGIHSPGVVEEGMAIQNGLGYLQGQESIWNVVLEAAKNQWEQLKDTFVNGYENVVGWFNGDKQLSDVLTNVLHVDKDKVEEIFEAVKTGDYATAVRELTGLGLDKAGIASIFGINPDSFIEGTSLEEMMASTLGLGHVNLTADEINADKVENLGQDNNSKNNLGSGSTGGRSSQSSNLGKQTTTVSSGGLNISMTEGYTIGDILNRIDRLETAITNMQIVLDTGILAGQVASGVDKELGTHATMNGRWN